MRRGRSTMSFLYRSLLFLAPLTRSVVRCRWRSRSVARPRRPVPTRRNIHAAAATARSTFSTRPRRTSKSGTTSAWRASSARWTSARSSACAGCAKKAAGWAAICCRRPQETAAPIGTGSVYAGHVAHTKERADDGGKDNDDGGARELDPQEGQGSGPVQPVEPISPISPSAPSAPPVPPAPISPIKRTSPTSRGPVDTGRPLDGGQ